MNVGNRPSLFHYGSELVRANYEFAQFMKLRAQIVETFPSAPAGKKPPVLIIPGFLSTDLPSKPLISVLGDVGYAAYGWEQGVNIGPSQKALDGLRLVFERVVREHKQKVAVIGHSLGGIFARELAKAYPQNVSQVITLASPFGIHANPDSTNRLVEGTFSIFNQMMPGQGAKTAARVEAAAPQLLIPPPVHTRALYTRGDGIVGWQTCVNPNIDGTENLGVTGVPSFFEGSSSHIGMLHNVRSITAILNALAQEENNVIHAHPAYHDPEINKWLSQYFTSVDQQAHLTLAHLGHDDEQAESAPHLFMAAA